MDLNYKVVKGDTETLNSITLMFSESYPEKSKLERREIKEGTCVSLITINFHFISSTLGGLF